jgi:hypothetical protein
MEVRFIVSIWHEGENFSHESEFSDFVFAVKAIALKSVEFAPKIGQCLGRIRGSAYEQNETIDVPDVD